MNEKKKHAGGRPRNEFKQEWCAMLIKHMAQGYSFESFGALIDSYPEMLYTFCERYPEFLDAKKKAQTLCRQFWEHAGIQGLHMSREEFNATVWIFNMKNRFGWKNVDEVQVTHRQQTLEEWTKQVFGLVQEVPASIPATMAGKSGKIKGNGQGAADEVFIDNRN